MSSPGLAGGRPRAESGPLLRSRVRGQAQQQPTSQDSPTRLWYILVPSTEDCQTTVPSTQTVTLLVAIVSLLLLPSCLPWERSGSVSYSGFYEQASHRIVTAPHLFRCRASARLFRLPGVPRQGGVSDLQRILRIGAHPRGVPQPSQPLQHSSAHGQDVLGRNLTQEPSKFGTVQPTMTLTPPKR